MINLVTRPYLYFATLGQRTKILWWTIMIRAPAIDKLRKSNKSIQFSLDNTYKNVIVLLKIYKFNKARKKL